ncbi:transglutaminase family protein [Octadecabacter sp. G9-8]|uniref:Transglutaminase family protein n=1 Tax=Octadecabacter dasysiphoniae TaxID=2909341 RepID=A0ABS9CZU9_9RHOB|nr:transglutaminase family protein [Octadecabacter dasysiphoniae]MCF2872597.1 transglutaminase family protein [Octadecabacter dasysiphoniae]
MQFRIKTHLVYSAARPSDVLLQIEALHDDEQLCLKGGVDAVTAAGSNVVSGDEGLGLRRWVHVERQFECTYDAIVDVVRGGVALDRCAQTALASIPGDVTKFLMPSRYCYPEDFFEFCATQFGALSGGALIAAMSNWIKTHFTYDIGASDAKTTATQSFAARAGVCRDYAHVLIAMARAVGVPARFVSVYAPDVSPQDFHAVAEVYLGGRWHLVDPTGMAQAPEIVRIGVGRDAADVSFMTSYGELMLIKQTVEVSRVAPSS